MWVKQGCYDSRSNVKQDVKEKWKFAHKAGTGYSNQPKKTRHKHEHTHLTQEHADLLPYYYISLEWCMHRSETCSEGKTLLTG